MEQRKVLLIIVSVTIVLAATIGVGIWLFYPREPAQPESLAQTEGGLEWEPLDYLKGDGELPDIAEDEAEEGEFIVTYGVTEPEERPGADAQPDGAFVEEQPPEVAEATDQADDPTSADRPGDDRAPADAPGVDADLRQPSTMAAAGTERAEPAAARTPTTAERTASEPTASESRAPASTQSAQTELADRAYWVQAISSPNRDTIEQAQRTLRGHQLGTRILTKEIGGTTYFRLRLGPFAVRAEAEKFLGWVVEIDGFEDAMIFVDYTTVVLAAQPR